MAKRNGVTIRIDGDDSGFQKKLNNVASSAQSAIKKLSGLTLAMGAAGTAVAGLGAKYNTQLEQLQTSFEVMTGSAEKAVEIVSRLRTLGAETPYEMTELAGITQLLMQYGFSADDAISNMQMLGDVAQGNSEALQSIALGYAQMSSAQKVNLQDIKQMINGGFNPLQEISERTGESMGSLYERISKGTMSVDEITESMRHATSEGGKFFQSMEKQSQTLSGRLSTLKGNASQLLGSLTEGLSEELRDDLLPLADEMIGTLQKAFDERGTEGLIDAASEMLPDLLNMMTGKMEDAIASLSKFAPKAVQGLMGGIPGAIRSATTALPQITNALFEVSGVVVEELVSMLPELVPLVVVGFADMLGASLNGVVKLMTGFYSGIEQAIHRGQTKIMGMWVDDSEIAKFDFSMDIDISGATSAIETAYSDVRSALQTDLLTDPEREEVLGMIGADYDAIKAKLLSFGLTDEEATPLASTVAAAGEKIRAAFEGLDVGVPADTLLKWIAEANGSRLALRMQLKNAGLTDSDIAEVTGLYDEMLGKVSDGTPSIMEEIYTKLSDGEPDDQQTVDTLKGKIESYIGGLLTSLEAAYQSKLTELDTSAADYAARKAELDAWYESTKASITGMDSAMRTLVTTLAGAPTETVKARLDEFAAYEQQLFDIEAEIDRMSEKATSAAENAFKVVKSGAQADEATISTAIKFKNVQFSVDTQAAEDAYAAAVEDLNARLAKGDLTKEEFNAEMTQKAETLETQKAAAKAAYEQALGEIFAGIAESQGVSAAVEEAGRKLALMDIIETAMDDLRDESGSLGDKLGEPLTQMLAEHLQNDPDLLRRMPSEEIIKYLEKWAMDVYDSAESAIKEADNAKLTATYAAALEDGMLIGTDFNTDDSAAQLTTLLEAIAETGATNAKPALEATGETVGETVTGEMADVEGADTAGTNVIDAYDGSLLAGVRRLKSAGRMLGKAVTAGYREELQIHSPSKVAIQDGKYTGQGYEIGLRESMERAAALARHIMGGITTSASLRSVSHVDVPNLQQEIMLANEQSPAIFQIDGKEFARATASDTNYAQNSYKRSIALGVGK